MTKTEYRDNIIHALRMEFEIPQWIEFYNKYLSDSGRTELSIVEMGNFDDWTESYSHFDIAQMIYNGKFNPWDEYFYISMVQDLISFSCTDDVENILDLEALAKWMIENNETFGEDVFAKLLGEYVSSNEPLNCEFVVLETDDEARLTVGKIYKATDGRFADDRNYIFPLDSKLKTFDELSNYMSESKEHVALHGAFYGGEHKILKIVR